MSSFDPQYRQESVPGDLTVTLYRISQAVSQLLRDKGQAYGLSSTQIQALLFLAYARTGIRTIGGLAERLGCTPATASGVADALERKGLVVRRPRPHDRRTVTLHLTQDGVAMVSQVDDSLAELENVVRELPEAKQTALLQATTYVAHGLAERGWVKVYGTCRRCGNSRPDSVPGGPGSSYCALMDAPVSDVDSHAECAHFTNAGAQPLKDTSPVPEYDSLTGATFGE
jgi:DNA-binding MarR family transcriptional regulator